MSRNLCRNSSAPSLFPLLDQPSINMATAGAGEPVVIWNENLLTGNFNPGKVPVQKILLENKKVMATAGQLSLTNASATKIMEFLKMKEHLMRTVVTGFPTMYTAGVGSSPMNLIHQSPSVPLKNRLI